MNRRHLLKSLFALPFLPACFRAAEENADGITAELKFNDKLRSKCDWEVVMYSSRAGIRRYQSAQPAEEEER